MKKKIKIKSFVFFLSGANDWQSWGGVLWHKDLKNKGILNNGYLFVSCKYIKLSKSNLYIGFILYKSCNKIYCTSLAKNIKVIELTKI